MRLAPCGVDDSFPSSLFSLFSLLSLPLSSLSSRFACCLSKHTHTHTMKEEDKNKSSDKQARVSELCDCDVLFVPVSQTKARVTERTLMLLLLLWFFFGRQLGPTHDTKRRQVHNSSHSPLHFVVQRVVRHRQQVCYNGLSPKNQCSSISTQGYLCQSQEGKRKKNKKRSDDKKEKQRKKEKGKKQQKNDLSHKLAWHSKPLNNLTFFLLLCSVAFFPPCYIHPPIPPHIHPFFACCPSIVRLVTALSPPLSPLTRTSPA